MRRQDLYVENAIPPVNLVLNPYVRELHVSLFVTRQVVLLRPRQHLVDFAIRTAVAVFLVSISFLQELLMLPLQLIVQGDAVNMRALFAQALGLVQIRAVDLRVVCQLAGLVDAMIESLAAGRI
jgi:hypothetical protein